MVQMTTAFQAFRLALHHRIPRIVRGCMASTASVGPIRDGRFSITVLWTNKDGSIGQHIKEFAAGSVFFTNGTVGVKLKRPVCRTADEVIREVLTVRKSVKA